MRFMNDADTLLVSAATIYEIDSKRRRKLRGGDSLLARMPQNMPATLPLLGFELLPITPEIAWEAARLDIEHADPWDRIIVAQARAMSVPLITGDAELHRQVRDVSLVW